MSSMLDAADALTRIGVVAQRFSVISNIADKLARRIHYEEREAKVHEIFGDSEHDIKRSRGSLVT